MRLKSATIALFSLSLAAMPAMADSTASVDAIEGSVMLARDGVLTQVVAGSLEQGDRIITRNGAATLTFADGCVIDLKANAMAVVGEASPCANGEGLIQASEAPVAQGFSGMSTGQLIGAGLVTVLALYGITEGLDDDPVSP